MFYLVKFYAPKHLKVINLIPPTKGRQKMHVLLKYVSKLTLSKIHGFVPLADQKKKAIIKVIASPLSVIKKIHLNFFVFYSIC